MHIGLIAGNGKFPFLVLDATRSLGHDVTVIAIKEEAFPEIEQAAARGRTPARGPRQRQGHGEAGTAARLDSHA